MKRLPLLACASLLAVSVAACRPATPQQPAEPVTASSSSSSSTGRYATVEGLLQKAGISIYMEGSHKLQMDDGTYLLLKSSAVRLDDSLDARVIVSGTVQPTTEAGGMIMTVELMETAEPLVQPEVLEEESSSTSISASSTSSSVSSSASQIMSVRSSTPSSAAPLPRSSSPAPALRSSSPAKPSSSSIAPPPPASSSPSSSAAAGVDMSASIRAMAKVAVDATTFTTKYCSSHIGFCIPLHKYWFYQSFGANVSPNLWHVEVSDKSIDDAGQGVIMVNLVSGGLTGAEGVAVAQGEFVVASRQWTGNRHFEISGPAALKAAVEFMANGIEVYSAE